MANRPLSGQGAAGVWASLYGGDWGQEGQPSEQVVKGPGSGHIGTLKPMNRQTHMTENITFLQLRWQTVINLLILFPNTNPLFLSVALFQHIEWD